MLVGLQKPSLSLTDYAGIPEQIKPLQLVGQAAEFKFESKFEQLHVIWQSLPKAV